jgi:hypothetical protein
MLVDRECGCNDTDPFECVNPDSPDSEVDGNWRCDCECHGEGLVTASAEDAVSVYLQENGPVRQERNGEMTSYDWNVWIEMDDRTDYRVIDEAATTARVSSRDDVSPDDEALIAQSLGQRLGGTWHRVGEWSAAEGENESVAEFSRAPQESK